MLVELPRGVVGERYGGHDSMDVLIGDGIEKCGVEFRPDPTSAHLGRNVDGSFNRCLVGAP
jgi:hypothetical protein